MLKFKIPPVDPSAAIPAWTSRASRIVCYGLGLKFRSLAGLSQSNVVHICATLFLKNKKATTEGICEWIVRGWGGIESLSVVAFEETMKT